MNLNIGEPFCVFPVHTMPYQISVAAQKVRAVIDSVNVAHESSHCIFIFMQKMWFRTPYKGCDLNA